jgi:O-antigen ligase/Flp pilus assembly protein TadD
LPWHAFAAAALPVSVVAMDPGGGAPFGPVKWLMVPTLVLLAFAGAAWRRPSLAVARRPARAWPAFLAIVAVAAAVGVDRLYAWTGTPERHLGALTWLLCAVAFVTGHALSIDARRLVAAAAAAACGLTGVWAGAEALGWQPVRLVGAGDRPVGPVGSSAYLGAALVLLVPVAAGLALDGGWSVRARRLAAVAAGVGAVGLVVSGARAAWVGALVAAAVVALVRTRPSWRAVATGAAAVVVLALATGVAGRVPDLVRDRDGGARGRADEWRVAARVVARHPLFGVGAEGYRITFGRAVDDAYERAHGRDPLPDRAHSAPLDVATTTGLPGLAAYVALVVTTGALVLRAVRRAPAWVAGTAAGLVAYAAQSLFLFPIGELEPVAWLLAGAVVVHVARPDELVTVRTPRPVPVMAGALAGVALVAGGLDVAADHAEPARAVELRPDALRHRLAAAHALEADGALDGALAQLDHALAVSPRDPVVRAERGRLLLARARRSGSASDLRQARAALTRLRRDDPRNAEVLLRLGLAEQLDGDDRAAEGHWRAAERLAPRSAAASTNLAVVYARAGRWADARAAATRALQRDGHSTLARSVLDEARTHGT